MDLISEFHSDHQKVVSALFELRAAIAARNILQVRSILTNYYLERQKAAS